MTKHNLTVMLDGVVFGLQTHGGISNYWGRLVQYMDALSSVDSHLVLPKRLRYAEYEPNRHPNTNLHTEVVSTALSRYLDVSGAQNFDVFHSSYFRVPTSRSTKYVVTVYDFIYERYQSGPARWVHSFQKLRSIRRADAVICISHATRNDVLRYVPDVDPSRVHVVYLGVDENTFYPERISAVDQYENLVLYVGQRGGHKRFDLAVEALARCSDLTLGFVGPEPTEAEVAVLNSRLHGRWHSFGPVSTARLRVLYSAVFAFICPSDYEGFGLPILEAMACGCPVVSSNAASLPEVGGTAALYALVQQPEMFASALTKLQISANERRNAIEAGLKQARQFPWSRAFSETIAIYQDVAAID